jgi:hypothetical protein
MSSKELKQGTWYHIDRPPHIKGRFQYAGEVDFLQGVKKYLFQCFAIDLHLTEDELITCVGLEK